MKKIQDSKVIGHQEIEGKKVPVIQPEVHCRISVSYTHLTLPTTPYV